MKLAVYFPGIGYHQDKPLLYYGREVALQCGYEDFININYSNHTQITDIRGNEEKIIKVFENLYEQAEKQLCEVDWEKYDDIIFVSKSIGTVVAAAYEKKHGLDCKNVFYTPLEQTFLFAPREGIAFTGTNDPWVNTDQIVLECQKANIPLTIIEQANHSLEVDNVWENIENLKNVMKKTEEYINE